MKVGDLVNFHVTSWMFHRALEDYACPGIIIDKLVRKSHMSSAEKIIFKILWTDLRITNEHPCYLKLISKTDTSIKKVL
jgi:hypothetical protein